MNNKNFWHKLKFFLSPQDIKKLCYLLLFSIFISIVELVGISAIMPFIAIIQDPSLIQNHSYLKLLPVEALFGSNKNFILCLGCGLIVFYLLKAVFNTGFYYALHAFCFDKANNIAKLLLDCYLTRPYHFFTQSNTANWDKHIIHHTSQFGYVILHSLYLVSELCVFFLLYMLLLYYSWFVTLTLSFILSIKIFLIVHFISAKVSKQGREYNYHYHESAKKLLKIFGNFKYIKTIPNTEQFTNDFFSSNSIAQQARKINQGLLVAPKNILESLGFSTIIIIVLYTYVMYDSITQIFFTLSIFILALYRILPAINRLISSYNQILFSLPSLDVLYNEIAQTFENEDNETIVFEQKIALQNVSFSFKKQKQILKDINLTISKNAKIAFIGESGSGKTTIVDLIAGIYRPSQGNIYVDQQPLTNKNIKDWRQKMGYIPQLAYLFDGTVEENICFGYDYNENKVIECLKKANIYDFFLSREGLKTKVGESGVQLSGGQAQRISIARALYKDPEILILDEATSALDIQTEEKIINEIYDISENKTLIIIAHRLTTIEKCDMIFEVKNNDIKQIKTNKSK